jgi:hypothetical protein
MTFSREAAVVGAAQASEQMLPSRGSDHPAFIEMGFVWGDLDSDPRFRNVQMPLGFSITWTTGPKGEIYDADGNWRAVVLVPQDRANVPSIYPLKRFTVNVESADGSFRGVAYDWGEPVYRTVAIQFQSKAVAQAKKWLDDHKFGWDSYSSRINFERRPTK